MRHALRYWFSFVFLLLTSATVLAAPLTDEQKANIEAKARTDSGFVAFFKGFFTDWTGWVITLSLVGLVVLAIAYFYVKKKQAED